FGNTIGHRGWNNGQNGKIQHIYNIPEFFHYLLKNLFIHVFSGMTADLRYKLLDVCPAAFLNLFINFDKISMWQSDSNAAFICACVTDASSHIFFHKDSYKQKSVPTPINTLHQSENTRSYIINMYALINAMGFGRRFSNSNSK
ncbi:hypothetical protein ACJX0J_040670, partial [Zea mays]